MQHSIVGIDVSKANFHAVLLEGDQERRKSFSNNAKGFEQLLRWLGNRDVERAHVCLEATGSYGVALATFVHDHGHIVSMVNPARVKGFAQSELVRSKTDAIDAGVIARFCAALRPDPWAPPAPEIRELQALTRRLGSLMNARAQELNRAQSPGLTASVQASIDAHIAHLDDQIAALEQQIRDHIDRHPMLRQRRELLVSIPGIGEKTASLLLGELPDITKFSGAKQVAAYAGLAPQIRQSGSSVRGKTRLSKRGNPQLRKGLFYPAMVAMRYNPTIAAFAARLRAAGKNGMTIVGASMRKLLHLVYGVLKSGTPYNPRINTVSA